MLRRYSRSNAATELSSFEYTPGRYARDETPFCASSHMCQSWRFVTSQISTPSAGSNAGSDSVSGAKRKSHATRVRSTASGKIPSP